MRKLPRERVGKERVHLCLNSGRSCQKKSLDEKEHGEMKQARLEKQQQNFDCKMNSMERFLKRVAIDNYGSFPSAESFETGMTSFKSSNMFLLFSLVVVVFHVHVPYCNYCNKYINKMYL